MQSILFTKSGVTSWGCAWEWSFGGGVELKAPDGHTLMVTNLNTQVSECNFEDDLFDRSFSMSPAQDTEWGQICWDCYFLESMIYGMALESFRSCADQLIQDFKVENPDAIWMPNVEFSDMLAACLDVIRKQQDWGCEELEWLFNCDGPINVPLLMNGSRILWKGRDSR